MEGITDIINEIQVRMSGEDIKNKMLHKAQRGGTNGRARLGYRNIRAEEDGRMFNSIATDDERAPLVHKAFELYASEEYSISELAEVMADLGLTSRPTPKCPARPVSESHWHRVLRDPYYTGVVR